MAMDWDIGAKSEEAQWPRPPSAPFVWPDKTSDKIEIFLSKFSMKVISAKIAKLHNTKHLCAKV